MLRTSEMPTQAQSLDPESVNLQAESSSESVRRSSAVLFDNPAYSAQVSPARDSTAQSGFRNPRPEPGPSAGGILERDLASYL